MSYRIKEVADMAGVSVRTLHHYDQIGLLNPESLSPAGYRLYTDGDLERLQQILFFKELDFGLQDIREILDSPGFDRKHALKAHKEILVEKVKRLEAIIRSIEKTIENIEGEKEMDKREMFDAFDMTEIEKHKEKYAEEVRRKYPKETVDECERRTSKYTEKEWASIMSEADGIYKRIASLMEKGPADPDVQEAVGRWRQHITKNYYTCTLEIFRGLGDLYVNDRRFTENIDKYGRGLAQFMKEAMHIYCDNY